MYGDGVAIPAASPYQWLTVTPIQYAQLGAWADGQFTDDRDQPLPTDFAALPPGRPDASPSTGPGSTAASAAPTTPASRCRGRCACR